MPRQRRKRTHQADRIWQPLNVQKNEFRIVKLHEIRREQGESCIHASLQNVSINNHPQYDALSYSWGSHEGKKRMQLNGKAHFITKNLYEALSTLFAYGITEIWVDALCIDQKDPYEKGAQVQRMATIFQEAENVMIWLGSASPGSDEIMSFLRNVNLSQLQQGFWGQSLMLESHQKISRFTTQFMHFLNREYWYRTWIVQEIAVAQSITVCCGTQRIDGIVMEFLFSKTLWERLQPTTYQHWNLRSFERFEHIVNVWSARHSFRNRHPTNLLELLFQTRLCKTSLLLDQVYAIIGLAFDHKVFVTEPDYTLAPFELCLQMSKRFMKLTGSLDLILFNQFFSTIYIHSNKSLSLPSWSCAFVDIAGAHGNSREIAELIAYINGHTKKLRCGTMGRHWSTTTSCSVPRNSFTWESQALKAKGLRIGEITCFVADRMKLGGPSYDFEKLSCLPAVFDSMARLLMIHSHMYEDTEHLRKTLLHFTENLLTEKTLSLRNEEVSGEDGLERYERFRWNQPLSGSGVALPCDFLRVLGLSDEAPVVVSSSSPHLVQEMIRSSRSVSDTQLAPRATPQELSHAERLVVESTKIKRLHFVLIDSEFVALSQKVWSSFPRAVQAAECLEVWLLAGCSMPVILERLRSEGSTDQYSYRMVSEALVDTIRIHGQLYNVMNGEAWAAAKEEDLQWVTIV